MSTIRRIGAVAAIAGAATFAFAGSASADPPKGDPLTLNCDDPIGTVEALVFSNGPWSPALDTNSNAVLHPVAFRDLSFEVRNGDGELLFSDSPPPTEKKGAQGNKEIVDCTFVQEFEDIDPESGEPFFITFKGTVEGWSTSTG